MTYSGQLPAGTPLREHDLAQRFSVGRHSVRSALQALAREGIAVHEPNRGVFVRQFTAADIDDVYLLRQAIEAEAVREIHSRGLPRNHVDAALAHMATLRDGSELSEMVLADLQVHRAIVQDSGSRSLDEAFESVMRELRLALAQTTLEYQDRSRINRQHHRLIEDVWDLPLAEAQEKIRDHNVEAITEVQAAIARA
jgi:DNA-binding GntR family transcriptional regulator